MFRIALLVATALLLVACGGTTPKRVPDLRGDRLDVAEARLEARGLQWEVLGGGTFGAIIESHWFVREQIPKPGARAATVKLVVERCEDDD